MWTEFDTLQSVCRGWPQPACVHILSVAAKHPSHMNGIYAMAVHYSK